MESLQPTNEQLSLLAKETLELFATIAQEATKKIQERRSSGAATFAYVNTINPDRAIRRLGEIKNSLAESYQRLINEPAIARVVADNSGQTQTYYICRTTPIQGGGVRNLASYRAPIGRLASLPIGKSLILPNGSRVTVLEKALLNPSRTEGSEWDSVNTVFATDQFRHLTIESLRALLRLDSELLKDEPEDRVEAILAEEDAAANLVQGIKRNVLNKMGLRDQPILDQYQDEIFRIPIDRQLLILGPPGTGKTTTLIRRLGQKLDLTILEEEDNEIIEPSELLSPIEHRRSWRMFTPTILLQDYLKEAFAREGIPASDEQLSTWDEYRRELARTKIGLLKSSSTRGAFVLRDNLNNLLPKAEEKSIEWFEDFNAWQQNTFFEDLYKSSVWLSDHKNRGIAKLGKRLKSIIENERDHRLDQKFSAFGQEINNVKSILGELKLESDEKIKKSLNLQLIEKTKFLEEIASFIGDLQDEDDLEEDDFDDQELDEDDQQMSSRSRKEAINTYMRVVRRLARAKANKREIKKDSRTGKIVEWLGTGIMEPNDLTALGVSLITQSKMRHFVNPVNRYFNDIPRRYRKFRRVRKKEKHWYSDNDIRRSDIHPLELDILILIVLKSVSELLNKRQILRSLDSNLWSSLKTYTDIFRNQILVDEVTDFSPIQVASMKSIAHPDIESFFACGDFNQRMTSWGIRTLDEIKWAIPEIELKNISVLYRQSRELNEFALAIIEAAGGSDLEGMLPTNVKSEGVAPTLLENAANITNVIDWLAARISEIEVFMERLPSIAIFVEDEDHVQLIASNLNPVLKEQNIKVVGCPNGQVIGRENDVRVFDVQHIKGLEFEAVFFVGIDSLVSNHPNLFDKYLYVGATRAATYLGLTCEDKLPDKLEKLRKLFVSDWKI